MKQYNTGNPQGNNSNNEVMTFDFHNNDVRIILDEQGNPQFVAKDVATALGYVNTNEAVTKFCDGVVKRYPILDSLGRTQNIRVIYEPDVYRLVFGSKLEGAKQFQDWVFEEVLPTIRKTGSYHTQQKKLTNTLIHGYSDHTPAKSGVEIGVSHSLGQMMTALFSAVFSSTIASARLMVGVVRVSKDTPCNLVSGTPTLQFLPPFAWRLSVAGLINLSLGGSHV